MKNLLKPILVHWPKKLFSKARFLSPLRESVSIPNLTQVTSFSVKPSFNFQR